MIRYPGLLIPRGSTRVEAETIIPTMSPANRELLKNPDWSSLFAISRDRPGFLILL